MMAIFSVSAHSNVKAYFNQFEGESYQDPYRKTYRRGHNLEKEMIKIINKAKQSVYVAIQELRLPAIAKALVAKKKAGVDVRVILEHDYNNTILTIGSNDPDDMGDHESSRYHEFFAFIDTNRDGKLAKEELLDRDAIYILKKAKIKIKDDEDDNYGGSTGLMHHKFIIVDGRHMVVSSANFTMSGVHGDIIANNSTGNSNAILTFTSKRMGNYFTEEFLLMWGGDSGRARKRYKLNKPFRGRQSTTVNGSKLTVQFSPTSKEEGWENSVNGLIGDTILTAKKNISMALFVFSDQKLSDLVQKRQAKFPNLKIGLMMEAKFAYRNYSEMLDFWGVELLNDYCEYELNNNPFSKPVKVAGVPSLNNGDMLHHKFAVIDGSKVVFGSQNWSDSANHSNDENVIVIEDKKVAAMFQQEFDRLRRNARLGPSKSLLKRIKSMENACY
jgi:phosphatidylserine/phosphatidylglycerophosphate/cardiolipin synthase-like enzyme